jgi:hypothetical protein
VLHYALMLLYVHDIEVEDPIMHREPIEDYVTDYPQI